jgi:phosphoribosyl-dephospho-CoA transferase
VWEHCDDRTKGMAGRVKTSSNLGSSRDVVMARIDSLLEQRSRKSAQERAKEEGYEAYKKAQQSNKRPVKSFEKWLQTVA